MKISHSLTRVRTMHRASYSFSCTHTNASWVCTKKYPAPEGSRTWTSSGRHSVYPRWLLLLPWKFEIKDLIWVTYQLSRSVALRVWNSCLGYDSWARLWNHALLKTTPNLKKIKSAKWTPPPGCIINALAKASDLKITQPTDRKKTLSGRRHQAVLYNKHKRLMMTQEIDR